MPVRVLNHFIRVPAVLDPLPTASRLVLIAGLACLTLLTLGCGGGGKGEKSLTQLYQEALKVPDAVQRARRLVGVAEKQQKAGDLLGASASLSSAREAANSISDPSSKASSLTIVAGGYARVEQNPGEAKQLLKDAAKAIGAIQDADAKVPALADLAISTHQYLKDSDLAAAYLKSAEDAAASISQLRTRLMAQCRIVTAYGKVDRGADAQRLSNELLELARAQADAREKSDFLADVAGAQLQINQGQAADATLAEALKASDEIATPDSHAYALLNIARKLAAAKRKGESKQLLSKAQDQALQVKDTSVRTPLMEEIDAAITAL
jgi:tetratricopeptide (TPR) repeat protein